MSIQGKQGKQSGGWQYLVCDGCGKEVPFRTNNPIVYPDGWTTESHEDNYDWNNDGVAEPVTIIDARFCSQECHESFIEEWEFAAWESRVGFNPENGFIANEALHYRELQSMTIPKKEIRP